MNPLVARFIAWLRLDKGLSKNSIEAYQRDLQQFVEFIEPTKLEAAQEKNILHFLDHYKKEGLKNSSLRRKISSLKSFYKFLSSEEIQANNPTEHMESPKTPRNLPKFLSLVEIQKIFSAIPLDSKEGIRDRALLELLYATGMRVSELTQLKLYQWLEDQSAFRVSGKGGKERLVLYSENAKHWLKEYQERVYHEWNLGLASDFFFVQAPTKKNKTARPLSRQFVWALLKYYAEMAGLQKNISPHQFRHSFATNLVQAGMNLRFVQSLLGHSDISTTQIYTHVEEKKLAEAYRKFHPRK